MLRRLAFSLVPVTSGVLVAEMALRWSGFTPVTRLETAATAGFYEGAYVHRRDMEARPWFVSDGQEAWSNPRLVPRGFHAQRFSVRRDGQSQRIFALGGSTTQGAPFENENLGFPQLLQTELSAQGKQWQVVNAGVAGLDSTRFAELAEEAVELDATGLVIYAGHNEISGRLIDRCLAPEQTGLSLLVEKLRLMRVLGVWMERFTGDALPSAATLIAHQDDCMRAALERSLADAGVSKTGHREDELATLTRETFADEVDATVGVAARAGIPVWIGIPAVNLLLPPVEPRAHPSLPEDTAQAVGAAWARFERGELALLELQAAAAIDPTHAGLRWALGSSLLRDARTEQERMRAREHLQAAVDWDYRGTRVTSWLTEVLQGACASHDNVVCIDFASAFEQAGALDGGAELFVDHCHPSWKQGTPIIAKGFAEALSGEHP